MEDNHHAGFDMPVDLPTTEDYRRSWYEEVFSNAQESIKKFAEHYQWEEHVTLPLIKKMKVCETKEHFDHIIREVFNLEPQAELPASFSAVIADDILFVVLPETYAKYYPEGKEQDTYEKLIAHELAHALHIRILEGKEDEMGPQWFYEGFALFAANQFHQVSKTMKKERVREIIRTDESVSYVYYRLMMDELLKHINLKEAVRRARTNDFKYIL